MRENPLNSIPNPAASVKKMTYVWKPKNDIRINELARCIKFVTHPICHDLSMIDSDCLRHFEALES